MSTETEVQTSVVMPVYRPGPALRGALAALEPQILGHARELILVESSRDGTADEIARDFPWLRVIDQRERTAQGRARNIGAAAARGELIAFVDADAVPEPDWLEQLESALSPETDAVTGAVVNGTPHSAVGTAGYLLEFAEWSPSRRGRPGHAATCNLLVRRDVFGELQGFAEDVWTGEDTLFTVPLAASGRLVFAPDARVRHMNRTRLRGLLRDQHKHGVGIVEVSRRVDFEHGWVNRPLFAPLALAVKLLGVLRVCAASPHQLGALVLLAPVIAAGLAAWTVGLIRSSRFRYPLLPYPEPRQ